MRTKGGLPSSDDGFVELPGDDCADGPREPSWRRRRVDGDVSGLPAWLRGDHPRDVILGDDGVIFGDVSDLPDVTWESTASGWRTDPRLPGPHTLPADFAETMPPVVGGPRGDHPRDVIPGPSAGASLAAGNIDLPEEVVNDELDDLFVDVTTASPQKEDRWLANKLRRKKKYRVFEGSTAADIHATLVQGRAPDVEA